MSAHSASHATRAIRAETAGSSALALGPNQRGNPEGEVEASTPVMAMAHQRTRGKVFRRTWPNLAATQLDQGDAGATGRVSRFSLARAYCRQSAVRDKANSVVTRRIPPREPARLRQRAGMSPDRDGLQRGERHVAVFGMIPERRRVARS